MMFRTIAAPAAIMIAIFMSGFSPAGAQGTVPSPAETQPDTTKPDAAKPDMATPAAVKPVTVKRHKAKHYTARHHRKHRYAVRGLRTHIVPYPDMYPPRYYPRGSIVACRGCCL